MNQKNKRIGAATSSNEQAAQTSVNQGRVQSKNQQRYQSITQTQILILSALLYHERFGLEVLEAIDKGAGKRLSFSALYPNLNKLEDQGLLTSRWEETANDDPKPRKKFYKITTDGRTALSRRAEQLEDAAKWQPAFS